MMRAMSFIAKWIEFLSVGIAPDLTDRIAIFSGLITYRNNVHTRSYWTS